MKKLFILAVVALCATIAKAEDTGEYSVQIVPFSTQAGLSMADNYTAVEEGDEYNYMSVVLNTYEEKQTGVYQGFQIYLYLPQGIEMDPASDYGMIPGDRCPVNNKGVSRFTLTLQKCTTCNIEGYNQWLLTGFTNKAYYICGENGQELVQLPYGTSSTLADGLYPIYIHKVKCNNMTGVSDALPGFQTSYFTVGTVTEAQIPVKGIVPSHVTELLNNSTSMSEVDLTEATAIKGDLKLKDNVTVTLPAAGVDVDKVSYERTLTNNWGTICLPYEVASDANVKYYTLKTVTPTEVTFEEAATVAANTPAVFEATTLSTSKTGVKLTPAASMTAAEVEGLTLTGTFTPIKITEGYYIGGNKFWNAANKVGGVNVAAYRAYFAGSGSVKSLNILVETETGIKNITNELDSEDIYNLQGIKLNRTQKGINIIGGQKVLVK